MPVVSDNETGTTGPEPTGIVPKIIPRSEHQVSRKNIDREALKVLYRLRDAGFTAYLVGGGVRDLYLGKTPKDFDISTDARPGQIHKLFRNSRLIGRRFRLVQVFFRGNKIVEVSTFRRRSEFDIKNSTAENKGEIEVLPANNTFGTPADDAFRRDLTINGLFYEINTFSIIDYTGGVADLDQGIIRLIGDPDWLDTLLLELLAFPNGQHDDQVDSVSQFLNWASLQKFLTRRVSIVGAKIIYG